MIIKCPICDKLSENVVGGFCSKKCYSVNWHRNNYKKQDVCLECHVCGIKFNGRQDRKYCSNRCYVLSRSGRTPIEVICKGCGKSFISMHRSKFYCSKECRWKNKKRVIGRSKPCRTCGNMFLSTYGTLYCSDNCKPKSVGKKIHDKVCVICSTGFKGEKNWKYCSKGCRDRFDRKNKSKRSYNNKKPCEFCGFSDKRAIHAHHINRASSLGVMFLCANHHYIFHSIVGNGTKSENNSKEEVLNVLKNSIETQVNV